MVLASDPMDNNVEKTSMFCDNAARFLVNCRFVEEAMKLLSADIQEFYQSKKNQRDSRRIKEALTIKI